MEIYFEYPLYLVPVAALIAAAVAILLYYKDKTFAELSKWKKNLMTILRFAFVFIILILLLNPIFKSSGTIIQKPLIIIAQDNSKSIVLNRDSTYYKQEYKTDLDLLISKLEETYEVKYLQFDEKTGNDSILDFNGNLTDISAIFPEIIARYSGMNLGAVIIATDGIYNRGINPAYSTNLNFPVYSIALGDTIAQKDLIIKDIMHNRIAFLGNRFPLRVFISAEKCIEKESEIIIRNKDKIIYKSIFNLPENGTTKTLEIEIPAERTGIQQYSVELKHLQNEISYENNHIDFVINVIDNRNKILILANGPHPDIGALRFALKDNPDFELSVQYVKDFNQNIKDFDLIILHQLPSLQNKATNIFTEIEKNAVPCLFILGTSSSIQAFNALDTGLEINALSNKTDDAVPYYNSGFMAYDPGVDASTFYKNLSPLKVFFGDYKFYGDSKILLYQTVNGVKTEKPLLAFSEQNKAKNGFILGEGLWRWRLDDYKYNSEHTSFISLINRTIQYLIVRKIQDKLIVDAKQIFNENEPVIINASFYNEAYELVPNLEVNLSLKNNEDKEFKYIFSNFGNSYRIDIGRLPAGLYKYTAQTKFDNKDYYYSSELIVQKINAEALATTANHSLLYKLAEITGASVFYPHNMQNLDIEIKKNPNITNIAYKQDRLFTITDLAFIFFIILAFATCEWILRKYWGGY